MAYVIAEPCIGTKDTACVDACPVDCIHPKKDEAGYGESGPVVHRSGGVHRLRRVRAGMPGVGDLRGGRPAGEVGGFCDQERGALRAVRTGSRFKVRGSRNMARALWAARYFFAARKSIMRGFFATLRMTIHLELASMDEARR